MLKNASYPIDLPAEGVAQLVDGVYRKKYLPNAASEMVIMLTHLVVHGDLEWRRLRGCGGRPYGRSGRLRHLLLPCPSHQSEWPSRAAGRQDPGRPRLYPQLEGRWRQHSGRAGHHRHWRRCLLPDRQQTLFIPAGKRQTDADSSHRPAGPQGVGPAGPSSRSASSSGQASPPSAWREISPSTASTVTWSPGRPGRR